MILNICSNDYANYSHDNARALRSIGLNCIDIVEQAHRFKYETQSRVLPKASMIPFIKEASIVQVIHSNRHLFDLAKQYCKGEVVVYHTGSNYRNEHEYYNKIFAGHRTFSDQTEFDILGKHNYIVSPVELPMGRLFDIGVKFIGHYPSLPETKGTPKILEMLSKFEGFKFKHSIKHVSNEEQIKRMAECDIYVELFKPDIKGKPYGCFGVTALEAAAMGRIVVTQNLYKGVYERTYGTCPLTIANTEEQFMYVIDGLLKMHPKIFREMQKETFEIMRENHNFENTGNKIAKYLYE